MNNDLHQVDGKFYKECQVVMLVTKDRENAQLFSYEPAGEVPCLVDRQAHNSHRGRGLGIYKPKHLYFLSDDEIKDGDLYIHYGVTHNHPQEKYHNICKCYRGTRKLEPIGGRPDVLYTDGMFTSDCKKIIATTNPELNPNAASNYTREKGIEGLPRPSDAFIKRYIEEYNKGNVIDKVLVEYEEYLSDTHNYGKIKLHDINIRLKVAPDNTITIKPVQEDWDSIFHKFVYSDNNSYEKFHLREWLKENYHPPKRK